LTPNFAFPAAFGQLVRPDGIAAADPVRHVSARPVDVGLTLQQSVDRFLKENLELRAMHEEIPMAQADIEAAGQPPQAFLLINVGTHGINTWRIHTWELFPSRWIDTLVARTLKRVIETQYQNAVRTRLDRLYRAFVDVEAAQLAVNASEANLRGYERLQETAESFLTAGQVPQADVAMIKAQRTIAALDLEKAKTVLVEDKLILAHLLNLPEREIDKLTVPLDLEQATTRAPNAPPVGELIRTALIRRPDLRAYRLGLHRAQMVWLKALIEPLSQIAVRLWIDRAELLQPRQAGKFPAGNLGVIVSLPTSIRNRGRLKRAQINVAQARLELAKVESRVTLDVRKARLDYEQSRSTVDRYRKEIIPDARASRDGTFRQWQAGEVALTTYIEAQKRQNDAIGRYQDAAISFRRASLALNTAVGDRIMP
jgi:cobalt-zinc-cadmium efflux system outer membrane protein